MNRTEQKYAEYLELRRIASEISAWMFEPIKLRLALSTFYTPDFMVIAKDGLVEFHEVKGHWEDDARVKVKCVADKFHWFIFCGVTHSKRDGWSFEMFNKGEENDEQAIR